MSVDFFSKLGVLPSCSAEVAVDVFEHLSRRVQGATQEGSSRKSFLIERMHLALDCITKIDSNEKKLEKEKSIRGNYNNVLSLEPYARDVLLEDDDYWRDIILYYPKVSECEKRLLSLSPCLALQYRVEIIKKSDVSSYKEIYDRYASEFLRVYFGKSEKIQQAVFESLMAGNKIVAAEVFRLVSALGEPSGELEDDFLAQIAALSGVKK